MSEESVYWSVALVVLGLVYRTVRNECADPIIGFIASAILCSVWPMVGCVAFGYWLSQKAK